MYYSIHDRVLRSLNSTLHRSCFTILHCLKLFYLAIVDWSFVTNPFDVRCYDCWTIVLDDPFFLSSSYHYRRSFFTIFEQSFQRSLLTISDRSFGRTHFREWFSFAVVQDRLQLKRYLSCNDERSFLNTPVYDLSTISSEEFWKIVSNDPILRSSNDRLKKNSWCNRSTIIFRDPLLRSTRYERSRSAIVKRSHYTPLKHCQDWFQRRPLTTVSRKFWTFLFGDLWIIVLPIPFGCRWRSESYNIPIKDLKKGGVNLSLFTTAQRSLLSIGERLLLTIPCYDRWTIHWKRMMLGDRRTIIFIGLVLRSFNDCSTLNDLFESSIFYERSFVTIVDIVFVSNHPFRGSLNDLVHHRVVEWSCSSITCDDQSTVSFNGCFIQSLKDNMQRSTNVIVK